MHTPYSYQLKHDQHGRIIEKTETVEGQSTAWTYAYDKAGRLSEARLDGRLVCQCHYDKQGRRSQDVFPLTEGGNIRRYAYTMDNRLISAGNNTYTHDKQGFRSIWNHKGKYTTYQYAPDHRLLEAHQEDEGVRFTFDHDENGQRMVKYRNGDPVEAYGWLDFIRLSGFHDGTYLHQFIYAGDTRLPHTMQRDDGAEARLFYDQIGSLRVVADVSGNVIKEVLYDPFGGILEDTNPGLRIPLGFAGGLHDRDFGLVRFGWRDYDPHTSRWTAPDPMGDAGGDPDWYGYCLDDPVNMNDPMGLFAFLLPFAAGMAGATAIGGTGSYLAAKAADWFGEKSDKDYGKSKPTATEGVHDAMEKVVGINSGIVGAAGAANAAHTVSAAAPTLIRKGRNTIKSAGESAGNILRANPALVDKTPRVVNDVVNPNLPLETNVGQKIVAAKFAAEQMYEKYADYKKNQNVETQKKIEPIPTDWWGR